MLQIYVEVPSPFKNKQSIEPDKFLPKRIRRNISHLQLFLGQQLCFVIATLDSENTTPQHLKSYS